MKAARLYSGIFVMSVPSITIEPLSMGKAPAIALRVVDFPAPFEPITVQKSPSSSVKVTPRRAFFSLAVPAKKVLCTFLTSSIFRFVLLNSFFETRIRRGA